MVQTDRYVLIEARVRKGEDNVEDGVTKVGQLVPSCLLGFLSVRFDLLADCILELTPLLLCGGYSTFVSPGFLQRGSGL